MTVLFKGEPVSLAGKEPAEGGRAPDFTLVDGDLRTVTLDDVIEGGRTNALLIVVPSLDTGVCALETRTFNARLPEMPADVRTYVVSRDLPFAQARWAKEQGDMKIRMLSDFRDHSFGPAYGVLIDKLGLLARSIFLIGKDKTIKYKQVVPDVGKEPDYEDAIAAAFRSSSGANA